jgi:hypothetical protein
VPFLRALFGTAAVGAQWWLFLLACVPPIFLLEEVRKALVHRRQTLEQPGVARP